MNQIELMKYQRIWGNICIGFLENWKKSNSPEPDIYNSVLMGLKPVETSRKHASKLGKTLMWVNWGDTMEEYWI